MPGAILILRGKRPSIWQTTMHNDQSGFALSPGVSFCVENRRIIFLDQTTDRYLTLARAQHQAFLKASNGMTLIPEERQHLDTLVDQGLLIHTAQTTGLHPCCGRVPGQAIEASRSRPVPALAQVRFAWRIIVARRRLKQRGLHHAIREVQDCRSARVREGSPRMPALQEAADLLALIGRYMTRLDQCLPISLGLAHYLLRQGVDCQLVMGVQLGPFSAHCWVQHGDLLVGDDLDVVRTFTPILVA